jgi:hypothetical protein
MVAIALAANRAQTLIKLRQDNCVAIGGYGLILAVRLWDLHPIISIDIHAGSLD